MMIRFCGELVRDQEVPWGMTFAFPALVLAEGDVPISR
jgi:hypothetical protein